MLIQTAVQHWSKKRMLKSLQFVQCLTEHLRSLQLLPIILIQQNAREPQDSAITPSNTMNRAGSALLDEILNLKFFGH